jgi:hypothetical protein
VVLPLPNTIDGNDPVPLVCAPVTPLAFTNVHAYVVTKGAVRFDVKFTTCVATPVHTVWLVVVLVIDGIGFTVIR